MIFFSRMIALNAVGPNVLATTATEGDVRKVYVCDACSTAHDFEMDAQRCCPPEVFAQYECPACESHHSSRKAAADCCGAGPLHPRQCPVCLRNAETFEDAADCCLHTHPTITTAGRERIAQAVASGTPWQQAVEQAVEQAASTALH